MTSVSIVFGAALILLGVAGYFLSGMVSLTALIPAAPGLLLVIFGLMARDPAKRKMAMHIAVAVALLGFLGSVSGIIKVVRLMGGEQVARPRAAMAQAVMAVLLLIYVVLAVRSFINARRTGAMGEA